MVAIGKSVFRISFESSACSGVSTTPGATALNRMCSFAYSRARLPMDRVQTTFGDHWNGSWHTYDWVIRQCRADANNAAAAPLCLHLFYRQLRYINKA